MMHYLWPFLIFGHFSVSSALTSREANSFNNSSPEWVSLAPISRGPRQENGVTAVGEDVYIVGGTPIITSFDSDPSVNWVDVYSTKTNTWRSASPLPVVINHSNTVSVNGKIYVLGGMSGNGTWVAFPDCFEYCPVLDKWTRLPSMPESQARGSSALGVKGSTIYLAGGLTSLDYITGDQYSVATVTSYNIVTKEWSLLPDLPEGRDHVGGAVVGDTFYVVGGRVNGVTNVRNTTFALDLKAAALGQGRWTELAQMHTARGGLATSHLDGVIYTFGGEGNISFIPNGVYNETEAYDIKLDKWIKYSVMPVPRHGTQAVAVGRCNYVPGGGWHTGTGPMNTTDAFCV